MLPTVIVLLLPLPLLLLLVVLLAVVFAKAPTPLGAESLCACVVLSEAPNTYCAEFGSGFGFCGG